MDPRLLKLLQLYHDPQQHEPRGRKEYGQDTGHGLRRWNEFVIACHLSGAPEEDVKRETVGWLHKHEWPIKTATLRGERLQHELELLAAYDDDKRIAD